MPNGINNGVSFGIATHVGQERPVNQDSAGVWIAPPGNEIRAVFVLADGMGGGHYGDEASKLAVDRLLAALKEWHGDIRRDSLLCEMKRLVGEINREIYGLARAKQVGQMGTTVDLLLVTADDVLCVHVGDGRVYSLSNASGEQITEDHSALNDLVKQGVPLEVAVQTVGGNQVTQIVGTCGAVDPRTDPVSMDVTPGQIFAICCDGVHGSMEKSPPLSVGPLDMAAAVAETGTLQAAAERIVNLAVTRDGSDNATVVLVRIEPEGVQIDRPMGYKPGEVVQVPGGAVGDLSHQASSGTVQSASGSVNSRAAAGASGPASGPRDSAEKARKDRLYWIMILVVASAIVAVALLGIAMKLGKRDNQPKKPASVASKTTNPSTKPAKPKPSQPKRSHYTANPGAVLELSRSLKALSAKASESESQLFKAARHWRTLLTDNGAGNQEERALSFKEFLNTTTLSDCRGLSCAIAREAAYSVLERMLLQMCAEFSPASSNRQMPSGVADLLLGLNMVNEKGRERDLYLEKKLKNWEDVLSGKQPCRNPNGQTLTEVIGYAGNLNTIWSNSDQILNDRGKNLKYKKAEGLTSEIEDALRKLIPCREDGKYAFVKEALTGPKDIPELRQSLGDQIVLVHEEVRQAEEAMATIDAFTKAANALDKDKVLSHIVNGKDYAILGALRGINVLGIPLTELFGGDLSDYQRKIDTAKTDLRVHIEAAFNEQLEIVCTRLGKAKNKEELKRAAKLYPHARVPTTWAKVARDDQETYHKWLQVVSVYLQQQLRLAGNFSKIATSQRAEEWESDKGEFQKLEREWQAAKQSRVNADTYFVPARCEIYKKLAQERECARKRLVNAKIANVEKTRPSFTTGNIRKGQAFAARLWALDCKLSKLVAYRKRAEQAMSAIKDLANDKELSAARTKLLKGMPERSQVDARLNIAIEGRSQRFWRAFYGSWQCDPEAKELCAKVDDKQLLKACERLKNDIANLTKNPRMQKYVLTLKIGLGNFWLPPLGDASSEWILRKLLQLVADKGQWMEHQKMLDELKRLDERLQVLGGGFWQGMSLEATYGGALQIELHRLWRLDEWCKDIQTNWWEKDHWGVKPGMRDVLKLYVLLPDGEAPSTNGTTNAN